MANVRKTQGRTPLPFIAKACIFLAGFSNPFLGYALYFVMYDTDEEKAKYFRYGAFGFVILLVASFVLGFVLTLLGYGEIVDSILDFLQ